MEEDSPKGGRKILSRYRGTSIGSCHDLCKYEIKRASVAEVESPTYKREVANGSKVSDLEKVVIPLQERNKKSTLSSKRTPTFRNGKPDSPIVIEDQVETLKNEDTLSARSNQPTLEEIASSKNAETVSSKNNLPHSEETDGCVENTSCQELKTAELNASSSSEAKEEIRQRNVLLHDDTSNRKGAESRNKKMRKNVKYEKIMDPPNVSSPKYFGKKSLGINPKSHGILTSLRNHKDEKGVKPEQANAECFLDKTLCTIESASKNEPGAPPLMARATTSVPSSSFENRNLKRAREGIQKPRMASSFGRSSKYGRNGIFPTTTAPSSSRNRGLRHTLYRAHGVWSSSTSSVSPSNSCHGKQSDTTSENNGTTGNGKKRESLIVGYKLRPRKSTAILGTSENKSFPSRKLNFRRGRLIEVQPQNTAPRRLKFRRAQPLREAQTQNDKDDIGKGSNGRKQVDNNKMNGTKTKPLEAVQRHQYIEGSRRRFLQRKGADGNQSNGVKSKPEQVVLRHQDVEGKKTARSLYNNVIEETASKLAEDRKSKVKALVGAFETVISLQDAKPPLAETTAC